MTRSKKMILVSAAVLGGMALVALIVWFVSPAAVRRIRDHRPNILFISIDTLRADHMGCYGYHRPTTPNLDRLAAEGVRFSRDVTTASFTLPAHVSMFTGEQMGVHRVAAMRHAIADGVDTITKVLHRAGYATVGIACAPYLKKPFGFAQGFDVYDDRLASMSIPESEGAVTSKKAVSRAMQQIEARRRQPWFVFLHMWDPHYDYVPPPPFDKKFADEYHGRFSMAHFEQNQAFHVGMDPADYAYTVSQYDGEIAWTDHQLGRLFAWLKKSGLWDQTAIFVTGDHGEEFLEHGQRGHGHALYDELVHVPLLVKMPGVKPGRVIDCPVSPTDFYLTFAELAETKPGAYEGDGGNLLNLILDRQVCDESRVLVSETNISRLDKYHGSPLGYETMIETGGVKFFHRIGEAEREMMFDIRTDPLERRDLIAERPAQARAMRERLIAIQRRQTYLAGKLRMEKPNHLDVRTRDELHQLGYVN